jgi:putative ABC transport system permease protein
MAAMALTRPEVNLHSFLPPFLKRLPPAKLQQQGAWLKQTMKATRYYQDPELSLNSLAEKLHLQPYELSRIVNTALKKSFSDFINEYRVAEVTRKMKDPAYRHLTLLGIAIESGFNSKTTFNRAFKQVFGKNPIDYKNELEKRGFIS